jgi:hypothetical protein
MLGESFYTMENVINNGVGGSQKSSLGCIQNGLPSPPRAQADAGFNEATIKSTRLVASAKFPMKKDAYSASITDSIEPGYYLGKVGYDEANHIYGISKYNLETILSGLDTATPTTIRANFNDLYGIANDVVDKYTSSGFSRLLTNSAIQSMETKANFQAVEIKWIDGTYTDDPTLYKMECELTGTDSIQFQSTRNYGFSKKIWVLK